MVRDWGPEEYGPRDHINKGILQTMVSGLPCILGLRTSVECRILIFIWALGSLKNLDALRPVFGSSGDQAVAARASQLIPSSSLSPVGYVSGKTPGFIWPCARMIERKEAIRTRIPFLSPHPTTSTIKSSAPRALLFKLFQPITRPSGLGAV